MIAAESRRPSSHAVLRPLRVSPLGVAVACVVVIANARPVFAQTAGSRVCSAPFSASVQGRMTAPSFTGGPGLFEVPTATVLPDGDLTVAYNRAQQLDALPATQWQNNAFFTVAFLPRVTLTARASVRHTGTDQDRFGRDLSANVQVQLLDERGWRPALMAGMHDVSGASTLYPAKFAALTKSFAGRVRVTAGYGSGAQLLDGPFGGVELAPCRWVTFIAEHDGRRRSAGVRLYPFPSLADRLGVRPTIDAAWLGEQGWVAGFGLRMTAGPSTMQRPQPVRAPESVSRHSFGPAEVPMARAAGGVRDALASAGLENVRILPAKDGQLDVEYENRRWLLDDMDGLGVALGIIAARVPSEIQRVRLTIRAVNLPVLVISTALAPWRAFLADPSQERAFVDQLAISFPPTNPLLEGVPVNESQFRLDVSARPRIETLLMNEYAAFSARYSVLPEFNMQLGPGIVLTGRTSIPVGQTKYFLEEASEKGGDRLLLQAAARIPDRFLPRGTMGIGQVSVGRLGQRQVGAEWDQNVEFGDGRWAAGVTGAVYGETASHLDHTYGLGTIRWRHPEQELTASLSAGIFRFGDKGGIAELSRRFGLVEVGFTLRATDLSSQAGIRVTVPTSPRRQARPRGVRMLMPDFYDITHKMTVFEPYPTLRNDVARTIDVGHEVVRTYSGRNWLTAGTIRARAWAIRNAALRERSLP